MGCCCAAPAFAQATTPATASTPSTPTQSDKSEPGEAKKDEAKKDGKKTNAKDVETLDSVVITGTRRQAEKFVSTKRDAARVVDSVGESEAGQLPAQNAAELVSFLPGVATFSDRTGSDNLTTTEGRFASVRGIRPDLNITTMDGLNLGIPNQSGRANFLDWFPVSLAKRVEVIKTFTPEDDASAIGGQINIVTRSGFEYRQGLMALNASLGYDQIHNGVTGRQQPMDLSMVYAKPLSDTVALAFTANLNRRHVFLPSKENVGRVAFNADGSRATFFPGFNNFIGPVPGNGIAVPLTNRLYANDTQTDRSGFASKLDFRLGGTTTAWLTAAYTRLDQHVNDSYSDVRQPFLCFAFAGCVNRAVSQSGSTGTITERFNDAAFSEALTSRNLSQLTTAAAGVEHLIGDRGKLEFKAALSQARQDQNDYYSFFGQDARDITFDYDIGNPMSPAFTVHDADNVFNPATYKLRRVDHLELHLKEKVVDSSLKYGYNASDEDRGWGFKVGGRYKLTDRKFVESLVTNVPTATAPVITLPSVQSGANVYGLGIPGVTSVSRPVLIDPKLRDRVILPLLGDPSLFTPTVLSDLGNDYTIKESTLSQFVQGQFRSETVQFVGGLRHEGTKVSATGYRSVNAGPFEPVAAGSTDGHWLPSALVNWDATAELKLRAAYSRTLGRPPYDALAPRGESLTIDAQAGTATLTRSNPDLKPRRSDNYDLAVEWYFDRGKSLLSAGAFYKKIKDEIFVSSTVGPMTIGDQTYAATTSQPMNAESAFLRGLEVNAVKEFTFLPAPFNRTGVQANATFIHGDFSLPRPRLDGNGTQTPGFLPNQPSRIYNLTLYYTSDKVDMNVSVNRTGSFVVGFFPDAPQNDIYFLGRTLIGTKLSYAYDKHLKLFFEGNNLTSKDLVEVSGPPALQNVRRVYRAGRTFNAGLTYAF